MYPYWERRACVGRALREVGERGSPVRSAEWAGASIVRHSAQSRPERIRESAATESGESRRRVKRPGLRAAWPGRTADSRFAWRSARRALSDGRVNTCVSATSREDLFALRFPPEPAKLGREPGDRRLPVSMGAERCRSVSAVTAGRSPCASTIELAQAGEYPLQRALSASSQR